MDWLFGVSRYNKLSDINRASIAYSSTWLVGVLFTLYALFVPFSYNNDNIMLTYFERAVSLNYPLLTAGFSAFYILFVWGLVGVRRGRLYQWDVALAPATMLYVGAVSIGVVNNVAFSQNALLLVPVILLAGLLDGERGFLVYLPVYFVTLVAGYAYFIGRDPANTPASLILVVFISIAVVSLLYVFLKFAQITSVEVEVESSKRRLQLSQLTTRITRGISQIDDMNRELNQIVEDIRDSFPEAYHVQVFLIEETGRIAELVASTGSVGQQLLERKHGLPVGSLSVIGQVTQRQESVLARVGVEDGVHRPNDLLPETRLEVAFPLNLGSRNIGALDVQARNEFAFDEEELVALQAIADSIAVTIDNSRLLAQTQERLRERQELVERMTAAQEEVQRLNRELTGTIWSDYLRGRNTSMNVDFDFDTSVFQNSTEFTEAILSAIENKHVVRRDENGHKVVAIPLQVRGEVIGAMEFEVDDDLTTEDMDLLQEIGERFGLAAENNRLYQVSQRVAQREALVNEISTRIQSANSVEATIAEAARGLRDALKSSRVSIRLGAPTPPNTSDGG